MKKFLKIAMSVALLGGVLLITPQHAAAVSPKYSAWVSINGNDGSAGSGKSCTKPDYNHLQDALDDASDGWVIYLCAGTYRPADDEDNYFEIYNDVTIVGASRTLSRIAGNCATGDGTIRGYGYDLTLKNLTVSGGCIQDSDTNYDGGGAVALTDDGDFTCNNVTFSNNFAYTSGGAVWADQVNLNKCSFSANRAAFGGAVYAYGSISDKSSTFNGNIAYVDGGAVYSYDGGTFEGSVFSANGAGFYTEGWGGAIFAYQYYGNDLVIKGAKFTGNQAYYGGAVAAYDESDSGSAVRTFRTVFTSNNACYGGGVDALGSAFDTASAFTNNEAWSGCGVGGGFYIEETISLSATKFTGNIGDNYTQMWYTASCDWADVHYTKLKHDSSQDWNWDCI